MLIAVAFKGWLLCFASKKLQNDKEVVKTAIAQDGMALKYASYRLQNDKKIAYEAAKQNIEALQYVSKDIQEDIRQMVLNQTLITTKRSTNNNKSKIKVIKQ